MAVQLDNLRVNGIVSADIVRVLTDRAIFSWSLTGNEAVIGDGSGEIVGSGFVEQASYEFRLGTLSSNWGNNSFVGNVVATGSVASLNRYYALASGFLSRGTLYYAQVRVTDELGATTAWKTARLSFNSLPIVSSVSILPASPAVGDDLTLDYIFSDADSDVESGSLVRWFRNGVHIRELDGSFTVESRFLDYGDEWSADILPADGYEYGSRSTTAIVTVERTSPVVEDVYISPEVPTVNDILTVNYAFTSEAGNDVSSIRWYVNGDLQSDKNDQRFVRLLLEAGDKVRVEVTPEDGINSGTTLASEEVAVLPGQFVIENIVVEGQFEPLNVMTKKPVLSWRLANPPGRAATTISLKIGTFWGADNVYSTTFSAERAVFEIPLGILNRGCDYFVSLAASDDGTYDNYAATRFRISGSRWNESVNNATGWTFETVFLIGEGSGYQSVKFEDGAKFGEVRIYSDKLIWASLVETESESLELNVPKRLTVAGQGSNAKVYLDGALVIDATGKLDRVTEDKSLLLGTSDSEGLEVDYYSVFYTTGGAYYPDVSPQFGDIAFHAYAEFKSQELVGIKGVLRETEQYKVVAANPFDERLGGAVYKIVPGSRAKYVTVNPTYTPINRIKFSPSLRFAAFAHSRGLTIFDSYYIVRYDSEADFQADQSLPDPTQWELNHNIGKPVAEVDASRGLVIDTSFDNIGISLPT
ncbi:MAG: hypothetical protein HC888_01345 [Candidatus Competibacteraceae bacterium]|nr:hypothetical protein [Candidatus Competibacteraceae bacterium]